MKHNVIKIAVFNQKRWAKGKTRYLSDRRCNILSWVNLSSEEKAPEDHKKKQTKKHEVRERMSWKNLSRSIKANITITAAE